MPMPGGDTTITTAADIIITIGIGHGVVDDGERPVLFHTKDTGR
ncbi:MAG TPA: hypothetical protein VK811_08270 [Candidatus Acidoferrum sp.]|jgi:hypothetical protein|nr:hypothetical protein [Candidatus Acidoferrum sp.]